MKTTFVIAVLSLFFQMPAQAGEWIQSSFSQGDGIKTFRLYVPASKVTKARPLLVALHGCLNSTTQFAGLARLQELADTQGVLLLMPQQNMVSNMNFCWNWHLAENHLRGQGEPALIVGMVRWVQKIYLIDPGQIFVFGPSAGGGMTSILLALYPDVFAAGMVGSGTMFKAASDLMSGMKASRHGSVESPQRTAFSAWEKLTNEKIELPSSVPVMVFHGGADTYCNPVNGEQATNQFISFNDLLDDGLPNGSVSSEPISSGQGQVPEGYNYTWESFGKEPKNPLIVFYRVDGMGHGWSGGDDSYLFNFPKGPDETALMWDFFKRHPRK
ncbi:MAG: PHB depolymerase esterase [Bdellovibrio sp. CG10_big_fil_rev_8_21_14_0_10_47_8]|nr:MAG: PHB depolymerase esterase [Bdellovibrio sp. CG10_big_fil_rev_8_21_14_0_10_47_8]